MIEDGVKTLVVWKRRALLTMGDVHDAVESCQNADEFRELMRLYRTVTDSADKNVRFDLDYWGDEELQIRILSYGVLSQERRATFEPEGN